MRARDNVKNTAGPGEVNAMDTAPYTSTYCASLWCVLGIIVSGSCPRRSASSGRSVVARRGRECIITRIKMASKGSRMDIGPANQDDSSCSRTCAHGCAGISIFSRSRRATVARIKSVFSQLSSDFAAASKMRVWSVPSGDGVQDGA